MPNSVSEFESPTKKIKRETDSNESFNVLEYETFHNIQQRNPEYIGILKKKVAVDISENVRVLLEETNNDLSTISEETEGKLSSQEEQISQKLSEQMEMMKNDLRCRICGEEFHEAVTLNCSHTFCKFCIDLWKTKKNCCPICRAPIISECRSLVIDSFVANVLQTQSEDLKRERIETLKAREDNKMDLVRELNKASNEGSEETVSVSFSTLSQDNTTPSLEEDSSTVVPDYADAADVPDDNAGVAQIEEDAIVVQQTEDPVRATADTNISTIWSTLRWLWRGRRQNP